MPTDPKLGLRVVHPKHGVGTITAVSPSIITVDHDADPELRQYVRELCTLTTEDGDPLTRAPAASAPAEHPPTDQHDRRPEALVAKEDPMPAAIKPVDNLLDEMLAALRERGPEAKAQLAAACGLQRHSLKNFITKGRVPDHHRDAVRAWIQAPHATAASGFARRATVPAKPKPAPATAPQRVRIAKPAAPPAPFTDIAKVVAVLGCTITKAWIDDGETMRKVRVAVLP